MVLLLASSSFAVSSTATTRGMNTPGGRAEAAPAANRRVGLEDFDVRRDPDTRVINGAATLAASQAVVSTQARLDRSAARDAVTAKARLRYPDSLKVEWHDSGIPKSIASIDGFLTGPRAGSPDQIARGFLTENSALFGLSAREVRDLRTTMDNHDEATGVTYLKYEQVVDDTPVFDSEIGVTITARGEVAIVNQGEILPGARVSAAPALTEEQGIAKAFEHCGVEIAPDQLRPSLTKRAETSEFTYYASPLGEGHEDVLFQKTIVNVGGEARLAYRAYVDKSGQEWYDTLVDADTGELLVRTNIVSDVQASVFTNSPGVSASNSRTLVNLTPQFGVTDPWVGPGTVTTGNNVDAYLDRDANNLSDTTTTASTGANPGLTGGRADSAKGTPAGQFTFAYSASADPTSQQANAVANLFYFNNYMHDWMYSLGFTESARNFQTNNFGRGGSQNDAVLAEAQDGSGTNNANFGTPPDGSSGRMQMYLWTYTTPNRDCDLDGDIALHEYGHGVSQRLIGNGSGLSGVQSAAMGEGWSDYWACSNFNDGAISEYSSNNPAGIRRAVYAVPANPIHDTYNDLGNSGFEVHADGEIWCAALWDLNRTLGKTKTDKLVLDGMKNTVTSPSMVDARTGIVTACQTDYPDDVCTVWTVFARHGLGNSASGNDGTTHNAATDLPISCGGGPCSSNDGPITPGTPITGTLAPTDCLSLQRPVSVYDNYTFAATAGTVYTITQTSTAFDSYLYLLDGSSVVAQDDNGGGSGNSMIVYEATASGTLTIHCTSATGQGGAYTVSLTEQPCSSNNGPIAAYTPITGSLSPSDCYSTVRPGCYYDNYTFAATAGTTYTITETSTAIDSYLYLLDGSTVVAHDDDGGGALNSKIFYIPSTSGTLTIHCTSAAGGATGAYTVTLSGGAGQVLFEGAESGATGWTMSTTVPGNNWVISPAGRATGANGFRTNNATATYPNNLNQSLISPAFTLAGLSSASLTYNIKRQTEAGADILHIEVSTNGGSTWTQVAAGSGTTSGFTTTPGAGMVPVTLSLNAYAGRTNVKIRFRFTTNGSVDYWGVALDDITVTAQ
jgi:hypothetical protein